MKEVSLGFFALALLLTPACEKQEGDGVERSPAKKKVEVAASTPVRAVLSSNLADIQQKFSKLAQEKDPAMLAALFSEALVLPENLRYSYALQVLSAAAKVDSRLACRLFADYPMGAARIGAARALIQGTSPESLTTVIKSVREELLPEEQTEVCRTVAGMDGLSPQTLRGMAGEFNGYPSSESVGETIAHLEAKYLTFENLEAKLGGLEDRVRKGFVRQAAQIVAQKETWSLMDKVLSDKVPTEIKDELISRLPSALAGDNPGAAVERLGNMTSFPEQDGFIRSIAHGWLGTNSIAASQWIDRLPAGKTKALMAAEIVSHLRSQGASSEEIQAWTVVANSQPPVTEEDQ